MKTAIRKKFEEEGFNAVGFCRPSLTALQKSGLAGFLQAGHHGSMGWMENRAELRGDPKVLWPDARSVIVMGHNYGPEKNPLDHLNEKERGLISCYAQGDDYHDVIKKK